MIFRSIWIVVVALVFMLLAPSVGYGWFYRGWGAPYPSYIQRRRAERAAATGVSPKIDHQSWGRAGDFVWVALFVGVMWTFSGILMH